MKYEGLIAWLLEDPAGANALPSHIDRSILQLEIIEKMSALCRLSIELDEDSHEVSMANIIPLRPGRPDSASET